MGFSLQDLGRATMTLWAAPSHRLYLAWPPSAATEDAGVELAVIGGH
jgi:hypothetical protein